MLELTFIDLFTWFLYVSTPYAQPLPPNPHWHISSLGAVTQLCSLLHPQCLFHWSTLISWLTGVMIKLKSKRCLRIKKVKGEGQAYHKK